MNKLILAAAAFGALSSLLIAQAPVTFDSVSIKPTAPDFPLPSMISVPLTLPANGGRTSSPAITAMSLILHAFRSGNTSFRPDQIIGAPGWANSTRFNFVGTSGSDVSREAFLAAVPGMVRTVLEERFKLKTHVETRTARTYVLVKARADGRLGPQMHASTVDCDAVSRAQREKMTQMSTGDFIKQSMSQQSPPCSMRNGPGIKAFSDVTLKEIVNSLGVDRPVVDRTGLEGRFSFELHYAPPAAASTIGDPSAAPALSDGPTIFSALEEQLGLKLEPRQESIDMLVIDHIEAPTPN